MRFTYEGSKFIIEFERTHRTVRVGYNRETGDDIVALSRFPYTTVRILKDDPNVLPPVIFRTYTVGAHFSEQFSLEAGRRYALRMLSRGNSLPKGFKRAMWDAYMNRKVAA